MSGDSLFGGDPFENEASWRNRPGDYIFDEGWPDVLDALDLALGETVDKDQIDPDIALRLRGAIATDYAFFADSYLDGVYDATTQDESAVMDLASSVVQIFLGGAGLMSLAMKLVLARYIRERVRQTTRGIGQTAAILHTREQDPAKLMAGLDEVTAMLEQAEENVRRLEDELEGAS